MKAKIKTYGKINLNLNLFVFIFALMFSARADDPRTNSWFTVYSGQYARIYTNSSMQASGTAITRWSNGSQTQSSPVYDGVQEVYSSDNWVYIRSSGLASYIMGPWQTGFPNLPTNQKILLRIPRNPAVPATKTTTGGGTIGIFVDGVSMFNSWDAFSWNGTTDTAGNGHWNRDAFVNEGATFDPGYAHQQNSGTYHYHASPIGLRYLLDDHVDFNATTKIFSEATNAPTQHSPILGWVDDGFPIYGPYGYSVATNANSGIRRMISGYVIRNGNYGTSNLTANGRTTIPPWAARLFNVASNIQAGPTVSASYPLGRYMEDNDYLGDHGYVQGIDFDLDEYNGRFCVTPEFPNGTYAYFVAINSNGTPVFPYNIGRGYYGSATGGSMTTIGESVITNFIGGPNATPLLNAPTVNGGTIKLTWSATEGGTYLVESTTDFSTWTTNSTTVAAILNGASYTNISLDDNRFYRVARTALATYDPVDVTGGNGGGGATFAVPGGSVSRGSGTNITLNITLPGNPPSPPAGAPITSVTLGTLTASGTDVTYTTQGTVLANFTIPNNFATGMQTVVVTFMSGPPPYTFTGGFTINP